MSLIARTHKKWWTSFDNGEMFYNTHNPRWQPTQVVVSVDDYKPNLRVIHFLDHQNSLEVTVAGVTINSLLLEMAGDSVFGPLMNIPKGE